jgi:hypothetical protein
LSESSLHEVALTDEEKDTILAYCGTDPLLVGGQALAVWATWFNLETPAELGDKVTTDADFVGSRSDARALNKHLHWTLWKPEIGDPTPQTAKLTKRVENNGVKQIDFLSSIIGLETSEIRKRAVPLTLPPSVKINILHPVHVLVSRLKNLQHLPHKQNDIGVAQARLSIRVVAAFLGELIAGDRRREALIWIERIADTALDPSLGDTLDQYELEPLKSIPVDKLDVPDFNAKRWPQLLELAHQARKARSQKREELAKAKLARNPRRMTRRPIAP